MRQLNLVSANGTRSVAVCDMHFVPKGAASIAWHAECTAAAVAAVLGTIAWEVCTEFSNHEDPHDSKSTAPYLTHDYSRERIDSI